MALTDEEHKLKLVKQQLKIQKEHEHMFGRYFKRKFMKYINDCFTNSDCEIELVYDMYTTRFTTDTYYQNIRFKQNIDWNGSLYSTMLTFPANTPDKLLFVIDMNNTTNKIVGIGLVRNSLAKDQSLNIYSNPSFNNYIYKSKYYVSIAEIQENFDGRADKMDASSWLKFIECEFEEKLFYGKSHSKRGGSFMKFPAKFKKRKHLLFMVSLFVFFNPNQFVENVMEKVKF